LEKGDEMKALETLRSHLHGRVEALRIAKGLGKKIVGYLPGGYMPEELILAAGAVPVCLFRGGEYWSVQAASEYICRWVDTFCRSQIGYGVSGNDDYYQLIDLLVVPVTDNHIRAVMDVLDYHTDIEIFPFGVPHTKEESTGEYYYQGLLRLKAKLEENTGVAVKEEKLQEAAILCNKERELLRKIALERKQEPPPIGGKEFICLNQGSLIAEKEQMLHILESAYKEIRASKKTAGSDPRILLTGSTLALGDNRVIEMVESTGSNIVIEDFAEGIRPYWQEVDCSGDILKNIVDCYFWNRVPPAWFRPGKERLEFLVKLCREFEVTGVIWYQLMYRESYKVESAFFPDILKKELQIPVLVLESDYDPSESGMLETRIDAFHETVRRR
jgi:benzoyl-CoA reductase/2-hydroxyglutaryl-CoA dehydratase subunit BcrC/BadD/HgdB